MALPMSFLSPLDVVVLFGEIVLLLVGAGVGVTLLMRLIGADK